MKLGEARRLFREKIADSVPDSRRYSDVAIRADTLRLLQCDQINLGGAIGEGRSDPRTCRSRQSRGE